MRNDHELRLDRHLFYHLGEAAHLGLSQVEICQRAQEGVGDQHVDGRLGHLVDRHAEPHRDRWVEVRHLDLDEDPDPAV